MRAVLLLCTLYLSVIGWGQISFSGPDNPNETTVAINPVDPSEIVAAANINNFYHSQDSGKTWDKIKVNSDLGVYGDPVLHYSGDQLFFAHLSKTEGKVWGDWFDRIVVQKITSISPWEEKSYSVGYNNDKMQDKPWMSSDNKPTSPFSGQVYVTWTEFDKYGSSDPEHFSRIRFSYYDPVKDDFSEAITISDTVGDCLDSDNTLEGAVTAVGLNGEVYAVWAGHENIYFDKSLDGGKTWSEDMIIGKQINGWDMEMPHIMRANGMPFIVTGDDGTIYVCWADQRNGDADIWLKYSNDGGESWSKAYLMNQGKEGHQYFPNMTYNSELKRVEVVFFDFVGSPNSTHYDVRVSYFKSEDLFLVHHPVTLVYSTPLPGERFFFGDYIDIDCINGITYVSYMTFNGTGSVVHVDEVKENYIGRVNHTNGAVMDVLLDKDTVYLTVKWTEASSFKGYLMVEQNGKRTKHRFNKKASASEEYTGYLQMSSATIVKVPIHSKSGVKVKLKAKSKNLVSKESKQHQLARKS